MKRFLNVSLVALIIGAGFMWVGGSALSRRADNGRQRKAARRAQDKDAPLTVRFVPWGPDQAMLDGAQQRMLQAMAQQRYLRGTRYQLLSFGSIMSDDKESREPLPPTRYRGVVYDYTNNRAIVGEGNLDQTGEINISLTKEQPVPNDEEFAAAVKVLRNDPERGPALRSKQLETYMPMPPLLYPQNTKGVVERTVNVGLRSTDDGKPINEIVGVNMVRQTVMTFAGGAPPTSLALPQASCGVASAGQGTTSNGTAGQFQIIVSQAGTELWNFLAIRPSASSGASSERSGIELQNVKYRGKSVLKRAHVPVLNVKYDGNFCGPYRDWQYQEGYFQANGTDVPGSNGGFRDCGTVSQTNPAPTTALENGTDTGNFKGVAVYTQGTETVLVTELNAGWYRYVHEWRLDADGTIRPRYGFGATTNSCVCATHHHHVYWRFDFDIATPDKNAVYDAALDSYWQPDPLTVETKAYRTQPLSQSWLIKNISTGEAYRLTPGRDGTAFGDSYARGDFWLLRYKSSGGVPTELDDPNTNTEANIDAWVNGESLAGGDDLVIWYGAHFDHADGANLPNVIDTNVLSADHVVGPDIVLVNW